MHLPLPFLSQSSSTKRQTYPRYFHQKNVQTWTVLSFGLLILRVHNSQTLTVGDIDDAHSLNKGKRNRKQKEEKKREIMKKRTNKHIVVKMMHQVLLLLLVEK